jgi:hypothetical protein
MSTGAIIAIVIAALLIVALVAFVMPRRRARARERQLESRRLEVADRHRTEAEQRNLRADYAEQQANRERAEAELHEARAKLHERGMADDELEADRGRFSRDPDAPAHDTEVRRREAETPPRER